MSLRHDQDQGLSMSRSTYEQLRSRSQNRPITEHPYFYHAVGALSMLAIILLYSVTHHSQAQQLLSQQQRVATNNSVSHHLSTNTSDTQRNTETHSTFFLKNNKTVWVYSNRFQGIDDFELLQNLNHRHFVEKSGYELKYITDYNFESFLPPETVMQLAESIKNFQRQVSQRVPAPQRTELFQFKVRLLLRRIAVLHVLCAQGGVMLDQDLALLEDLSWLESVDSSPFVNRVNYTWPTEVVGFYEPRLNNSKQRFPTNESMHAPFKMVNVLPGLHPGFLAAAKGARFLQMLCFELRTALTRGEELISYLTKPDYQMQGGIEITYISHRIIQAYHKQEKVKGNLAIDTLGISFINSYYGPFKIDMQLGFFHRPVRLQYLADMPRWQLEEIFGPSRYGHFLYQLTDPSLIQSVSLGERKIMRGSLLHAMLPTLGNDSLYDNPEVSAANESAPLWTSLPKKVWLIWLSGFEDAPVTNKVAYKIMKKRFEAKGYTVYLVNLANAEEYIGKDTMAELTRINDNRQFFRSRQTMSDLIRMELLIKHGGVYFDMATFIQDDVDWIMNIGRLPSHMFLNKFAQLPKVLTTFMFYMPYIPFWQINDRSKHKAASLVNYYNYFFIAEPNSEFFKQVQSKFKQMLETPWPKLLDYLQSSGCGDHLIVNQKVAYLLHMQIMTCVMLSKQNELARQRPMSSVSAAQHYGVWSFYGAYGPNKYWGFNHQDDFAIEPNSYHYDYSLEFSEQLIGKSLIPFYKMVGFETGGVIDILKKHGEKNPIVSDEMHPKSPFRRILDEHGFKIKKEGDALKLVEA